jgi:hypothetical protein
MPVEGRSLGSELTQYVVRERRLGNLATPASVQKLQTALHAKAKTEAGFRFYSLYDKIYREDILAHAYAQCCSNKGAPGVDGQNFSDIEVYGVQQWLGELRWRSRRRLTDQRRSDECSSPSPTASKGPWASRRCGTGSA